MVPLALPAGIGRRSCRLVQRSTGGCHTLWRGVWAGRGLAHGRRCLPGRRVGSLTPQLQGGRAPQ